MRDTWLVKGYPYVIREGSPTTTDSGFAINYIWINRTTDTAYVMTTAGWVQKPPDRINTMAVNLIYIIDSVAIETDVTDEGFLFIDRDGFEFIDRDDFGFIDR